MNKDDAGVNRREFLGVAGGAALVTVAPAALAAPPAPRNLAIVATPSASYVAADTRLGSLNSDRIPGSQADPAQLAFGTAPEKGTQWAQYDWNAPVTTDAIEVYWWGKHWGVALPVSCRLLYWDGAQFVPVKNQGGYGLAPDVFNRTAFEAVTTQKLRLEVTGAPEKSIGILQWRVWSSGDLPKFAPVVAAGVDRTVMLGSASYLLGRAAWLDRKPGEAARWRKLSGPGEVTFGDASAPVTTAKVSALGDYQLELVARGDGFTSKSTLRLRAEAPPPKDRLEVVYTTPYSILSPLWKARAKSLIVNWIPHCVRYCERTDLKERGGEGGLDNFIEAAKALRGEPHGKHKGYVFSNAWIHQTIESICIALMVDAQGDPEILAAQAGMRTTLEKWIPIVLAAQEPDGYLQTAYTLAERDKWPTRWNPGNRGDHEGYVAGYFIESAINHYTLTQGKDLRLYDAAKKLADCWAANIGPGKKVWFDGHQEMEQALVRFGRFVNDMEGAGKGDAYIALARFLLESRQGGSEYDQSHLPPQQQYEAVGHAVRAVYFYSGMADIAAETHDRDYQSAVRSLADNIVNRKYYVTGGVGSGDTAEGFGGDYILGNDAYCESCSSCGLVFFDYKMNLAYHDARYADLYEETMYNALLGATDLDGRNFCYTNPLVNTERAAWHVCPCCVGNIPRTLLMVPTWSYVKDAQGVYVNLFIGSRVNVGKVAGTVVEMVQETDYPWKGAVAITVNPAQPRRFSVKVRVPDRATSELYAAAPAVRGLDRLRVNGARAELHVEKGYAVITREWKAGDRIEFELPLTPQRIVADQRIAATRGKVALRYGPLMYNVELADQPKIDRALADAPLKAEWRGDLLGGVVTLQGKWADGSTLTAVPNFVRMNRGEVSAREYPTELPLDKVYSQVWIRAD